MQKQNCSVVQEVTLFLVYKIYFPINRVYENDLPVVSSLFDVTDITGD